MTAGKGCCVALNSVYVEHNRVRTRVVCANDVVPITISIASTTIGYKSSRRSVIHSERGGSVIHPDHPISKATRVLAFINIIFIFILWGGFLPISNS